MPGPGGTRRRLWPGCRTRVGRQNHNRTAGRRCTTDPRSAPNLNRCRLSLASLCWRRATPASDDSGDKPITEPVPISPDERAAGTAIMAPLAPTVPVERGRVEGRAQGKRGVVVAGYPEMFRADLALRAGARAPTNATRCTPESTKLFGRV